MRYIEGLVLLAVSVGMLLVGRPRRDGEQRGILRNWLILQIYAFLILLVFVTAVAAIFF
jgi:hypothetical protein